MCATEAHQVADTRKIFCFRLNDQVFGLPVEAVREVVIPPPVTRIYHVPEFVRGVINLRGEVLAVLDVGARVGVGPTAPGREERLVVIETDDFAAAVPVTQVLGIRKAPVTDIEMPAGMEADLVEGIVPGTGCPLAILRMKTLFDSETFRIARGIANKGEEHR